METLHPNMNYTKKHIIAVIIICLVLFMTETFAIKRDIVTTIYKAVAKKNQITVMTVKYINDKK